MSVDELDRKIIQKLREDCLTPFVRIAEELAVAEGTIRQRIKKLYKSGVIKRFTVIVDPKILGLGIVAFILLNVAPGQLNTVVRAITALHHVVEAYEVHTFGDLLIKVRSGNLAELASLISNHIKTIPGVVGSQVISVLKVWKDEDVHKELPKKSEPAGAPDG